MESSPGDSWTITILLASGTEIAHWKSPSIDQPSILRLRFVVDDTTDMRTLLGEWTPQNRAFAGANPSAPSFSIMNSYQPQTWPVCRSARARSL